MIGSSLKLALLERIEPHPGPLLSLYLDVRPSADANSAKAVSLRAAAAMRDLGLEAGLVDRLTTRLLREFGRVEGRTLVIFAAEDEQGLFDAYFLQTELPFLAAHDGALASFGEPLTAPLLFALDQRERYAVLYLASDRARLFEAFLGQVEELASYSRVADTEEWVAYREARRSPAVGVGVAARGGADVDRFRDRMEEATARLYRELLPDVERTLESEQVDRLILVGLPPAVGAFRELLPPRFAELVVGTLPPPPDPDAPAHAWLPHVQGLIAEAEERHELALLDRIRETGVWGVQECLSLLQEGRLHLLMVPWGALPAVFRTSSGRVAVSAEEARLLEPGTEVTAVPLIEALPRLVNETSTLLEFAEGKAEERLREELAGMGGLTRW